MEISYTENELKIMKLRFIEHVYQHSGIRFSKDEFLSSDESNSVLDVYHKLCESICSQNITRNGNFTTFVEIENKLYRINKSVFFDKEYDYDHNNDIIFKRMLSYKMKTLYLLPSNYTNIGIIPYRIIDVKAISILMDKQLIDLNFFTEDRKEGWIEAVSFYDYESEYYKYGACHVEVFWKMEDGNK